MPKEDNTRPRGDGQSTGVDNGFCAKPRSTGGCGRGSGRGCGHWQMEWGCKNMYPNDDPFGTIAQIKPSEKDEKTYLEGVVKSLEEDLKNAMARLSELDKL